MLTRIQSAVTVINAAVAPYGVSIYQVDAAQAADANVILEISTTTVVGGLAEEVLGCITDLGEITLVQGWDWYSGGDVGLIGVNQYDFQTVVTHELGHALGLPHCGYPGCVMYFSTWIGDTDRKGPGFCYRCRKRAGWLGEFQEQPG